MSEVITSGKVIKKPEVVLDNTDFLPPGIIDVRTQNREEAGAPNGLVGDNSGNEEEDLIVIEDADPAVEVNTLPVPQDMKIVSQTIKVGLDKKITVDVLLETSDLPGIRQFEARITKLS